MQWLSFLDPYMEGSGERWQSFLSSLRREILPNDSDAVGGFIAAAIMGFRAYRTWLSGDAAPDIQTRTRSQHLRPGTDPYSGINSPHGLLLVFDAICALPMRRATSRDGCEIRSGSDRQPPLSLTGTSRRRLPA